MTTVYDVPAEPLIEQAADELRDEDAVEAPPWADFTRTGGHREQAPEDADWWIIRCAAVLRKVYLRGPVGTKRLAAEFGGKRDHGAAPSHAVKGSGSIVRTALQQLEEAGLVEQTEAGRGGRTTTPDGQRFLDNLAHEVKQDLVDEVPSLEKY